MAEAPPMVRELYKDENGREAERTYAPGDFLGKGGFARCYSLTCVETGETVAAKIIAKTSLAKPKARLKFMSELKIHQSLRHPRIVQFYHYFEDASNHYMLLELCSNHTLSTLLKRRKRLAEHEVRYYVKQLLEGVQYLHSKCIIHRDLKLGNLLLTDNMQLKIGDFGLASHLDSRAEKRKTMCGTPNYIAPEILNGAKNDGHSFEVDIWSTGVVMYTLLVGKPPFETSDVKDTYKRIRSNTYNFPDTVSISQEARSLIRAMLDNDPRHRPTITQILSHSFFEADAVPRLLPSSSLHMTPPRPHVPQQPYTNNLQQRSPQVQYQEKLEKVAAIGTDRPQRAPLRQLPVQQVNQSTTPSDPRPDVIERVVETFSNIFYLTEDHSNDENVIAATKHQILQTRLAVTPPPRASTLWVTHYVDYSTKYGLGYVLSNNSAGAYFNDATKIIGSPDDRSFEYMDNSSTNEMDSPRKTYSMPNFDKSLNKKVTLMKHFKEYLKEEEKTKEDLRVLLEHLDRLSRTTPMCTTDSQLIYIRKWVKTRHAILFRLTNDTIQVDFFDTSKIMLANDGLAITYIDKQGEMHVLSTYQALHTPNKTPDLVKRLQYIKDMLQQMMTKKRG
ncbi:kinase [Thraustotheca clavata]|uniref:Serine/threonine-protein kinase PLK n=1 Tax=Thraustotheca clavata TaxID=74557 RepID=A0A1V9ZWQ9_9STRA|nr:kinase [Thraustotheca clavata]